MNHLFQSVEILFLEKCARSRWLIFARIQLTQLLKLDLQLVIVPEDIGLITVKRIEMFYACHVSSSSFFHAKINSFNFFGVRVNSHSHSFISNMKFNRIPFLFINFGVFILIADNFRPYLTSFQGNAFTDYINAVFVDVSWFFFPWNLEDIV